MQIFRPHATRWILGGALLVATLAALGVGVAHADPSGAADNMHFHAIQTSEVQLPLGHGESLVGNEFIDHWKLDVNGSPAGSLITTCQLVRSSDQGATAQCAASLVLARGQITVGGVVAISDNPPPSFELPVTGGTGAFRMARGVVHIGRLSPTEERLDVEVAS